MQQLHAPVLTWQNNSTQEPRVPYTATQRRREREAGEGGKQTDHSTTTTTTTSPLATPPRVPPLPRASERGAFCASDGYVVQRQAEHVVLYEETVSERLEHKCLIEAMGRIIIHLRFVCGKPTKPPRVDGGEGG